MTILIHIDTPRTKAVVHLQSLPSSGVACRTKGRVSYTNETTAVSCPACKKMTKARGLTSSAN